MRVVGESMEPTLNDGALVLVRTRAYQRAAPQRRDIVAVRPHSFGGATLIKRLVGLPGDTVECQGRQWQLGEDQYFLLSDQLEDSIDSRRFGPVNHKELIGPIQ